MADPREGQHQDPQTLCIGSRGVADYSEMMNFVGFVSGIEDHPDSLAYYEPMIVREAGRRLGDAE